MISLIIPAYNAGPNLQRTIDSCRHLCDDVVIIATNPYEDDAQLIMESCNSVAWLNWNHVFLHGFGDMMNSGTPIAKNDWILLLGVAETVAEAKCDIHQKLNSSESKMVFRCDHHNDAHTWKRIWNRSGGTHWSGLIHEEIVGGETGPVIFRMQDTPKEQHPDPLRNEVFRYIKTCSYNVNYQKLRKNPDLLGGTDKGWLEFVKGTEDSNESFISLHQDLIDAAMEGDFPRFEKCVEGRLAVGRTASGVNYLPTGK
jgi:cellulose synthase/poly-beta-1,6-N-acetylglucosamine synthase-like glycosyltransferase